MIQILQIASGVFIGGVALFAAWFAIEAAADQSQVAGSSGVGLAAAIGCVGTIAAIALVAGLWWLAAQFGWPSP